MKHLKTLCILLMLANASRAQNDPRVYNSLTCFYIDNSSGGTAPGLSQPVLNYLKVKMNDQEKMKDHYVYTYTVDSLNSILTDNMTKTVSFDFLSKYLARSSATADYAFDNDTIAGYFRAKPIQVKEEITIYIFLSSKAVDKMMKEMDNSPTPVAYPYKIAAATFYEKVLYPKIYLITNKDVENRYTEGQLLKAFSYYQDKSSAVKNIPVIMFK